MLTNNKMKDKVVIQLYTKSMTKPKGCTAVGIDKKHIGLSIGWSESIPEGFRYLWAQDFLVDRKTYTITQVNEPYRFFKRRI